MLYMEPTFEANQGSFEAGSLHRAGKSRLKVMSLKMTSQSSD